MERRNNLSYDLKDANFIDALEESVRYQIQVTLDTLNSDLKSTYSSAEELRNVPKVLKGTYNMSTKITPEFVGNYFIYFVIQVLLNKLSNFHQEKGHIEALGKPGQLELVEDKLIEITFKQLSTSKEELFVYRDFIRAALFRSPRGLQTFERVGIINPQNPS